MRRTCTIPNEILLDIFEYLEPFPGDLCNVILTCRKWCTLATPILYARVALDSKLREDSPAARFSQSYLHRGLVKACSIQITQVHLMGFGIFSAEAFNRLTEICEVLPHLEKLRGFSLGFEKPVDQGFPAPSIAIVSILNSLPKTVLHLNLDCSSLGRPSLVQPHICQAISAHIPRLRSLRLRASYLCSGLFSCLTSHATFEHDRDGETSPYMPTLPNAASALEHVVIRLDGHPQSPNGANTCICYSGEVHLRGARLAKTLQNLYESGAFPALQQFAVIGRVDAAPSPRNDHWNAFKVRYLTRNAMNTMTYPWCARGGSSSLFMIRDFDGDWFGSFDQVTNALEGPLAWMETGIGSCTRKNRLRNDTPNSWTLDHTQLDSRESVIQKFGVSFRLWKLESTTGMKLLQARTSSGFDDVADVRQIVPMGWRWVPEGPRNWTIEPISAS